MTLGKESRFAALWAFLSLNYLYCDVFTLFDAPVLNVILSGTAAGIAMTPTALIAATILMEIPMAMILVSLFAPYRANRWANVVAGAVMTVVQFGTLFVGTGPEPHYILSSVIEVSASVFVVAYALAWKRSS